MDYISFINEYGAKLKDHQKPIARRLFKNLIKHGWTYEQIFWGIKLLRDRPIEKYYGLFYYEDYIKEINQEVKHAQELINATYEEKVKELSLLRGYGFSQVADEYKEELELLDDKIWNSGNAYTHEELEEEVNYLYERCFLIPLFSIPFKEIDRYTL